MEKEADFESVPDIFDALGSNVESFKGMTYGHIGSQGCQLPAQ